MIAIKNSKPIIKLVRVLEVLVLKGIIEDKFMKKFHVVFALLLTAFFFTACEKKPAEPADSSTEVATPADEKDEIEKNLEEKKEGATEQSSEQAPAVEPESE